MKTPCKIAIIFGTRPEIIKVSPVIRELERKKIPFFIIHTNQHYSKNMDAIFLQELTLPKAKYNLGINATNHGRMVGDMLSHIELILLKEKPTHIIVQGDTNTALAGALAASKMGMKIGHIEAGLRSYDRTMPEEVNRVAIDHFSDYLFCPTERQAMIVTYKEGIEKESVYVTGNTIVDAVLQNTKLAKRQKALTHYKKEAYLLLTMHRPSNVDIPEILVQQIATMHRVADNFELPIYFPLHPRTQRQLETLQIPIDQTKIRLMPPVGYLEMLMMEANAKLILTDSGGLQEEACILRIPCVTLRPNTERPETIEVGANMLAGTDPTKILRAVGKMLKSKRQWNNPFGDGKAAKKIVRTLEQH